MPLSQTNSTRLCYFVPWLTILALGCVSEQSQSSGMSAEANEVAQNSGSHAVAIDSAEKPTVTETKTPSPKTVSPDMHKFQIGDFDLGINMGGSTVFLDMEDADEPTVTIEVKADEVIFDALSEDDTFDFSWATYPPEFYFREIPVKIDPDTQVATGAATLDDIDQYEFAFYMDAHHDVDNARVTISPDGTTEVLGVVEIDEKKYDLHIVFTPKKAG